MSGKRVEITSAQYLYVHVPFCPAKCEYCAFVTHIGSLKLVPSYVQALCVEADLRALAHDGTTLDTVYFGGGTPSMLTPAQVAQLLCHFDSRFGLASGCEVTLECHPSTITLEILRGFRGAGVTRVSFGGESLNRTELQALGRRHGSTDVLGAIETARGAGFEDIAVDFMYGIPKQSLHSWDATLRGAVDAGVGHLSLYPLSVEPDTVFARRRRKGQLVLPSDDTVVDMYALACDLLRDSGFEHYEVANWARPSHRCRHNCAYWRNAEFYAIGTGAHGYIHPFRTENVPHTKRYIDTVLRGADPVVHREPIDARTRGSETMMLGLRLLTDGPDLAAAESHLGHHPLDLFAPAVDRLHARGLVEVGANSLTLREDAVPIANEVWEHFLPD
jgi:oxygen-independent coproporphyrinogen III oxidase